MSYKEQIEELLDANGWKGKFLLEELPSSGGSVVIEIKLAVPHPAEPEGFVNRYTEGLSPLEQIQSECLRALRTGRVGGP